MLWTTWTISKIKTFFLPPLAHKNMVFVPYWHPWGGGVASARVHVFWDGWCQEKYSSFSFYALFHVNVSGFAGAKRGLSYTLFTQKPVCFVPCWRSWGVWCQEKQLGGYAQLSQKKVFCSMLGFLWWIVLSALYVLRAWWMYVSWNQDPRFLVGAVFSLPKCYKWSLLRTVFNKKTTIILEFGRDLIFGPEDMDPCASHARDVSMERKTCFCGPKEAKKVLILLIVQVVHSIFCRNASAFGLTWTRASLVKKSTPKKMSKNIGDTLFLVILKAKTGSQNHWPMFFWRHVFTPFVHVNYQCECWILERTCLFVSG